MAMGEWMGYAKVVLALLFVVGLILLSAAIAKRTGLDRRLTGNRGLGRRLEVIETLYLDPKRRVVIVRADAKEHVLLLGAAGDVLIETRERNTAHAA